MPFSDELAKYIEKLTALFKFGVIAVGLYLIYKFYKAESYITQEFIPTVKGGFDSLGKVVSNPEKSKKVLNDVVDFWVKTPEKKVAGFVKTIPEKIGIDKPIAEVKKVTNTVVKPVDTAIHKAEAIIKKPAHEFTHGIATAAKATHKVLGKMHLF